MRLFLIMLCNNLCPFLFCNHPNGEERPGYYTFIVFLMSCDRYCFVALLHGAVGWSARCDCVFLDHAHLLFNHCGDQPYIEWTVTYLFLSILLSTWKSDIQRDTVIFNDPLESFNIITV